MHAYRVYFIGSGDHFRGFKDLRCASDSIAIAEAMDMLTGVAGEVWQMGRKVARIAANGQVTRI
jgi:hypothetical protein